MLIQLLSVKQVTRSDPLTKKERFLLELSARSLLTGEVMSFVWELDGVARWQQSSGHDTYEVTFTATLLQSDTLHQPKTSLDNQSSKP